jgi:hypothetical protein
LVVRFSSSRVRLVETKANRLIQIEILLKKPGFVPGFLESIPIWIKRFAFVSSNLNLQVQNRTARQMPV